MKWLLLGGATLLMNNAPAQDPLKVAPDNYKLEFENEWVKVVRVHYGPLQKIVAHDHTQKASAYVYLNDGGPIVFKHVGLEYGAITRPPTTAGSFRLSRAVKEVHEVENPTDLPSDFMRVEFKTQPVADQPLRGRFYSEPYPPGENYSHVQFENGQLRITRLACAPNKKLDIATTPVEPTLLIGLSPARFEVSRRNGIAEDLDIKPGQTRWLTIDQEEQLRNLGAEAAEFLRFEFKTRPAGQLRDKPAQPHGQLGNGED